MLSTDCALLYSVLVLCSLTVTRWQVREETTYSSSPTRKFCFVIIVQRHTAMPSMTYYYLHYDL